MAAPWRVAVDIGGTFTDLAAWRQDSDRFRRAKVLTVPEAPVRGVVAAIAKAGFALSEASMFLHGYANPDHEKRAAEVVRKSRPEVYVSASTDLSGEAREYERTCTAVANAYVGPLVGTYVAQLAGQLERSGCRAPLLITQSNG